MHQTLDLSCCWAAADACSSTATTCCCFASCCRCCCWLHSRCVILLLLTLDCRSSRCPAKLLQQLLQRITQPSLTLLLLLLARQ
jgi:hypothetical protein